MRRVKVGLMMLAVMGLICGAAQSAWSLGFSLDIRANGQEGTPTINTTDHLAITVNLEPGSKAGKSADWFVVCASPFGLYYLNLTTGWTEWKEDLDSLPPTYQGVLIPIPDAPVLDIAGLPAGTYWFYFGIDTTMDGKLTMDTLIYDAIQVIVQESSSSGSSGSEEGACADIAGRWEGTYSETYCDGVEYSGIWKATITPDCHISAVTDEGDWYEGTINDHVLKVTDNDDACGTLTLTGTVQPEGMNGTYYYSEGGNGSFSGSKK